MLLRLTRTDQLDAEASASASTVDASDDILEDADLDQEGES